MGTFAQWLVDCAYEDMKLWIFDITHRFHRRYGGTFIDLLCESNYLFVYHLENYEFGRSSITTYLSQKIWYGLIDLHKTEWRRFNKHPIVSIDTVSMEVCSVRPAMFLTDLMGSIPQDAQLVVENVLNPDLKLARMLMRREGFRVERRALCAYFKHEHKWEEDRVYEAFWQIQLALRS